MSSSFFFILQMLNIQRLLSQHLTVNLFKTLYSSSSVTQTIIQKVTDTTNTKNEEQIDQIFTPKPGTTKTKKSLSQKSHHLIHLSLFRLKFLF